MKRKQKKQKQDQRLQREPSGTTNPLVNADDLLGEDHQRDSRDLIYESVMRGGGEPFFAPFEIGVSSLTDAIVRFFKQRSFFGFETLEKPRQRRKKNKFTRYGSAPYRGSHGPKRRP